MKKYFLIISCLLIVTTSQPSAPSTKENKSSDELVTLSNSIKCSDIATMHAPLPDNLSVSGSKDHPEFHQCLRDNMLDISSDLLKDSTTTGGLIQLFKSIKCPDTATVPNHDPDIWLVDYFGLPTNYPS